MAKEKQKGFYPRISLLLHSLAALPTIWADCIPPPIPIRLGNVSITDTQISRGLNISVGKPTQPFAFLPQWPLNNTFVYGTNGFCDKASDAACTTYRGGQYDQFSSENREIASSESHPNEKKPYPDFNWITESVTLNDNITLDNFPIGVALADWGGQGYHPQAAVGLGWNSTILKTLVSTGKIASRSWGMFWGRAGASRTTQLDGDLILGGYDRAKIRGENHTAALAESTRTCSTSMIVTITDVVLNLPNNTDISLFDDGSKSMSACIEPDAPVLMTIPYDPYFENFQTLTNISHFDRSFGIYFYGMLYEEGAKTYPGDLTIQLSSGLSIRIPNDQLVVPELTIDDESGVLVANHSTPELVLNSLQEGNADDMPILGRQFLSSAYVMLNQDAKKFTLWAANPTSKQDLVAVDSANDVKEPCIPENTTEVGPGMPAESESSTESKLTTGAIVGIAIGGFAGVAGVATILFLFWKWKTRDRPTGPNELPDSQYYHKQWPGTANSNGYLLEMQGSSLGTSIQPCELPATPNTPKFIQR